MTVHSVTGVTPNEAMLGREVLTPATLIAQPPHETHKLTVPYVTSFRNTIREAYTRIRQSTASVAKTQNRFSHDTIRYVRYGFLVVCYSNLTVFEIRLQIRFKGSLKVIGTDTYRSATYDFLLTFHSNHGPISHRFRDFSRNGNFPTPVYFTPPLTGFPLEFSNGARVKKLE